MARRSILRVPRQPDKMGPVDRHAVQAGHPAEGRTERIIMNIEAMIDRAQARLDDELDNDGLPADIRYWVGYIDALKAVQREAHNDD